MDCLALARAPFFLGDEYAGENIFNWANDFEDLWDYIIYREKLDEGGMRDSSWSHEKGRVAALRG